MSQARIFFKPKRTMFTLVLLFSIICAGYSAYWFIAANQIQTTYVKTLQDISAQGTRYDAPKISGFPGKMHLSKDQETINTPTASLQIKNLRASAWPFPSFPIEFSADTPEIQTFKWSSALVLDHVNATFTIKKLHLNIIQSAITKDGFLGTVTGSLDFAQEPYPRPDLTISMKNNEQLLLALGDAGIIDARAALFMNAGFNSFKKDGVVTLPINQRNQTIYAGSIPVASLPDVRPPAQHNPLAQAQ